MMESILLPLATSFWLGILTSVSPCPLATNITAVSYIGRRLERPSRVVLSGLLYTLGRTLTYVVLGIVLVAGLLSVPEISRSLQKYMNQILGPVLIIAGMFLLNMLHFTTGVSKGSPRLQKSVDRMGIWGALLLGIVFALSFCPISAALFFGSLVPLAINHNSRVLLPLSYGVGTALPVMICGFVLAISARSLGRLFDQLTHFERWARIGTGVVFIIVGVYLSLAYIFRITFF